MKMAEGTDCGILFGEECVLDGHDTTAEEDKLIAAGKMKPKPRGILTSAQHHRGVLDGTKPVPTESTCLILVTETY